LREEESKITVLNFVDCFPFWGTLVCSHYQSVVIEFYHDTLDKYETSLGTVTRVKGSLSYSMHPC